MFPNAPRIWMLHGNKSDSVRIGACVGIVAQGIHLQVVVIDQLRNGSPFGDLKVFGSLFNGIVR